MHKVTTPGQFTAAVKASTRSRYPGAKVTVRSRRVTFPTGNQGFVAEGTVTWAGRIADVHATAVCGTFQVSFLAERKAA